MIRSALLPSPSRPPPISLRVSLSLLVIQDKQLICLIGTPLRGLQQAATASPLDSADLPGKILKIGFFQEREREEKAIEKERSCLWRLSWHLSRDARQQAIQHSRSVPFRL